MINQLKLVFSLLMLSGLFGALGVCHAHQPHDVIQGLTVSPSFDSDGTLFALVYPHKLKKSVDGGHYWQELVNGLDNKRGRFTYIGISSSFELDQTLFVATEGDGIYKSDDGGASWYRQNNGLDNLNIAIVACSSNYNSDQTVLAAGTEDGIYISSDGGLNWHTLEAFEGLRVTAIAVSPDFATDNMVFFGDEKGNLYHSYDGGASMQQIRRFNCFAYPCNQWWYRLIYDCKQNKPIKAIAFSPEFATDGSVFIGSYGCGVYKSIDGGFTFSKINSGITDKYITSLAISTTYQNDATLFASARDEAVFQSNDGGNSWAKYDTGLPYADQGNIHYQYLAISNDFARDRTVFLGAFEGVFKSSDRGRIWLEVETVSAGEVRDIALSPDYLNAANVFIATYGGGAYSSSDGGLNWSVNNLGLERPFTYDVEFSPDFANDQTVYLVQYDFVAKSTNGGATWELNKIRETATIVPTVIVSSPDLINDDTLFLGSRHSGVFKSIDNAKNWVPVLENINNVTTIAISPGFPADRTVFLGTGITKDNTVGEGVFKTTNGGETWQSINNGLSATLSVSLAISPNYVGDQTVFAGTENGLFKTSNGGDSWQKLTGNTLIAESLIEAVAVSPNFENDQILVATARGHGLFKSGDGGGSWLMIGSELIENNYALREIEFSPSYAVDHTIYGASPTKLFKSSDGGFTWEVLERPIRYENTRDLLHYLGTWRIAKDYPDSVSALGISYSNTHEDLVLFNFVGTGIQWIGTMSDLQGIAEIYLDGVLAGYVDQYQSIPQGMAALYSVADLPWGAHSIAIKVTDNKNPAASDYYTVIDAFDVLP